MQAPRTPRLAMTGPMLRGRGVLHVVGLDDVLSIPDPGGLVYRIAMLADGSRTTDELVAAVVADFPLLGEQHAAATVRELSEIGLLDSVLRHADPVLR